MTRAMGLLLIGALMAAGACADDDASGPGDEAHVLGACDANWGVAASARCEAACSDVAVYTNQTGASCLGVAARDLMVDGHASTTEFRCDATAMIEGVLGCCQPLQGVHEDPPPAASISEVVFLVCE